jgi:hypothetical protein
MIGEDGKGDSRHPLVHLLDEFDARVWAKEFCKITGFNDEAWAIAWFANSIMCGYDYARREQSKPKEPCGQGKCNSITHGIETHTCEPPFPWEVEDKILSIVAPFPRGAAEMDKLLRELVHLARKAR